MFIETESKEHTRSVGAHLTQPNEPCRPMGRSRFKPSPTFYKDSDPTRSYFFFFFFSKVGFLAGTALGDRELTRAFSSFIKAETSSNSR